MLGVGRCQSAQTHPCHNRCPQTRAHSRTESAQCRQGAGAPVCEPAQEAERQPGPVRRHPGAQLARAERAQLRQQRLEHPHAHRSHLLPNLSSSVGNTRCRGAAQRPGRMYQGALERPRVLRLRLRLRTSLSHDTARKLSRCVRAALRCCSLHCCVLAALAEDSERCLLLCHAASDVRGAASACPGRSSTLWSTHGAQQPAHMLGCMVRSCTT